MSSLLSRPHRLRTLLAVAAAASASSCEVVYSVHILFDISGQEVGGFNCYEVGTGPGMGRDGPLMNPRGLQRLVSRGVNAGVFSLVMDFVPVDSSIPSNSPMRLFEWCATHTCRPLADARYCVTLPASLLNNGTTTPTVLRALDSLTGRAVAQNAPTDFVLVRAVAVATTCDALSASTEGGALRDFTTSPLSSSLMGCAMSGAVDLQALRNGSITLTLPTAGRFCTIYDVNSCAGL